jgi:hypothetical protein
MDSEEAELSARGTAGQWLWGLGLSVVVLVLLFAPSAIIDLLRDQPVGTTIANDLRNPAITGTVAMTFSAYALVILVGRLIYNVRTRGKRDS